MLMFSIIVPVYKVEKYLKKCIESVLQQTFNDFELILVDDGSPDNCPMICDEFSTHHQRISVIHKSNGGLSDARNVGIQNAHGQFAIFLDSDDFWCDSNFLYDVNEFIKNRNLNDVDCILFQGKKYYDESNEFISEPLYDSSFINNSNKDEIIKYLINSGTYTMSACSKVVRTSLIKTRNIYFEKDLLGEDLDWFLKLIMNVDNIYAVDNVNYVYRFRNGSITHSIGKKNLIDSIYILNKWIKELKDFGIDPIYEKYYYAILSYSYVVSMMNYCNVSKCEEKKNIRYELKKMSYLLKYNVNKKIKYTKLSYSLFGFDITARLLHFYYRFVS